MLVQYTLVLIAFQWQYIPPLNGADAGLVYTGVNCIPMAVYTTCGRAELCENLFSLGNVGGYRRQFCRRLGFCFLGELFLQTLYNALSCVWHTIDSDARVVLCSQQETTVRFVQAQYIGYKPMDLEVIRVYTLGAFYYHPRAVYTKAPLVYIFPVYHPTHETSEQGKPLNKQTTSMSQRCPLFRGFAIKHTDRCMLCSVVLE